MIDYLTENAHNKRCIFQEQEVRISTSKYVESPLTNYGLYPMFIQHGLRHKESQFVSLRAFTVMSHNCTLIEVRIVQCAHPGHNHKVHP